MAAVSPLESVLAAQETARQRYAAQRRAREADIAVLNAAVRSEAEQRRERKRLELSAFIEAHGGTVSGLSEADYATARRLMAEAVK